MFGDALCRALGLIAGTNSPLVAFVAGFVMVIFVVAHSTVRSRKAVIVGMRVMVGLSFLVFAANVLAVIFPGIRNCN